MKYLPKNNRGDTIVEVLISLTLLGGVLSGAYVVTSRSANGNQSSQDHLQASRVAETQLERLRLATASNPAVLTWDNFCIDNTGTRVTAPSAACADGTSIPYTVVITQAGDLSIPGDANAGKNFHVKVTWEDETATGGNLDYYYGVYR